MDTWVTRTKKRLKELDMTHFDLAKKLGITRGAITHYMGGRRTPPLSQFKKLAAILKVEPAWLQFGISTMGAKEPPISQSKKEKELSNKKPIPILSWEQVADFMKVTENDRNNFKAVPHFYTDQSQWFALLVSGDSMTNSLSNKSFHDGDIIIIDPDKTVSHGDFVIAQLPQSKEATFKQYVVDGGIRYLKPLNPQYPITKIDDSVHIFGVVVNCIS